MIPPSSLFRYRRDSALRVTAGSGKTLDMVRPTSEELLWKFSEAFEQLRQGDLNNLLDIDAAVSLIAGLTKPWHPSTTTPAAWHAEIRSRLGRQHWPPIICFRWDRGYQSAVDAEAAKAINEVRLEVIIAPTSCRTHAILSQKEQDHSETELIVGRNNSDRRH